MAYNEASRGSSASLQPLMQTVMTKYFVTTQHPYVKVSVTAQIALDLFENKENTRSVLLHSSMFDAVIGQIKGELSSYKAFI